MEYIIRELRDNLWTLDQNGVRAFLLVGTDKAILVDTCFGGDLKSAVDSITDKPVILITTHADPDHIGSDDQFAVQYMHEADFSVYENRMKKSTKAIAVEDGTTFDIGNFCLEVIHIPGHTPGSIALLDKEHRFLISGDTVQHNCIFMHGEGRDLTLFRSSIEKLNCMRVDGSFDTVYPSHGPVAVPADILPDHLSLAESLLDGTASPVGPAPEWFPDSVKTYRYNRAQMFY